MDMTGRVALVTGAARGIGKAIALELASRGADIAIAARSAQARDNIPGTIGDTAAAIAALGRRALAIHADVGKQADLERIVAETVGAFGRVDVLVNNAAITGRLTYLGTGELTREQFEQCLAVNVLAPFMLTKLCAPHLRAQGGGVVINLTSGNSEFGDPAEPASGVWFPKITYGTTKAALERMTNAMARDLYDDRIACIALNPGTARTELLVRALEQGGEEMRQRSIPVEWPARAAAFLATCPDPMQYTGTVVRTVDLVREQGLE